MGVATDRWEDLAGTDLVVIAAGIPTRPGQSRLDVNNADVARLDAMGPDAVVLIVTNPVDVASHACGYAAIFCRTSSPIIGW